MNDPKHRQIAFDECNVDGKFTIATKEFFCSVKRIDEPEPIPARSLLVRRQSPLFGQNGIERGLECS